MTPVFGNCAVDDRAAIEALPEAEDQKEIRE
jgi:hypothetical protein